MLDVEEKAKLVSFAMSKAIGLDDEMTIKITKEVVSKMCALKGADSCDAVADAMARAADNIAKTDKVW